MPDVRELERSPALLPLYVRAALPRAGGGAVPATTLRLRGVRPDTAHVARYAELCGFRLGPWLPPTYPHLLGFPLQMQLMAARDFPFAATGLVHVANSVTLHAPVPTGAALDVEVHAEGPHPHRRGSTVDMVTLVRADGQSVWTSTSTYLRRGPASGEVAARPGPDVPEDLPATARWPLPGDLGRRYAEVSGDRNPIHLWPLTARAFGFRRPIAHGMWTAAACVAALEGRLPPACTLDVEFRAPVPLPSTVELATRVDGDGGAVFALRSARSGRTHLLGSVTPA